MPRKKTCGPLPWGFSPGGRVDEVWSRLKRGDTEQEIAHAMNLTLEEIAAVKARVALHRKMENKRHRPWDEIHAVEQAKLPRK
jgi:hypothetical protein